LRLDLFSILVSKTRNFSLQTRARSDSSQRTPVSYNTTTEKRTERTQKRKGDKIKRKKRMLPCLFSLPLTLHLTQAHVHGPDKCSCLVNYFRTLVVQIKYCSLVVYFKYNILFIIMVTLQT